VIQNLLATARVEIRGVVTTLICAVVAASAGLVGVLFIGVAIFIWASENYGRLSAAVSMAAFFIAVAAIAVVILLVAQSKARKQAAKDAEKEKLAREEAERNAPPIWMDPSLIPKMLPLLLPVVMKAGQVGLRHRGLILAALSSAAVGWAMFRDRNAAPAGEEMPAAEQPAE